MQIELKLYINVYMMVSSQNIKTIHSSPYIYFLFREEMVLCRLKRECPFNLKIIDKWRFMLIQSNLTNTNLLNSKTTLGRVISVSRGKTSAF